MNNSTRSDRAFVPYLIASTSVVCIVVSFSVVHAAVSTFADGIVIGGTSLPAGTLLHVEGKIAADEMCRGDGTSCQPMNDVLTAAGGGGGGLSGSGSANRLPLFTAAAVLGNSEIQQVSNNIGIGRSPSQKLDVNGNIIARSGHLFLGSGAAQDLYGDNSSAVYYDSNHSTVTQLIMRDAENQQYGRLYGDGNRANFGLLDRDGQWSVLIRNDSYTEFRVNNASYLSVGPNGVSGNYGTVQVNSGGKGGWEGFSINGRAVFMHDGGGATGIYNDVNNRWLLLAYHNSHLYLYHGTAWRFRTESNGARTNGNHRANAYCNESGSYCIDTQNYDQRRGVYHCPFRQTNGAGRRGCNIAHTCTGSLQNTSVCTDVYSYDDDNNRCRSRTASCSFRGYLTY